MDKTNGKNNNNKYKPDTNLFPFDLIVICTLSKVAFELPSSFGYDTIQWEELMKVDMVTNYWRGQNMEISAEKNN
jgi:hypothetical protein